MELGCREKHDPNQEPERVKIGERNLLHVFRRAVLVVALLVLGSATRSGYSQSRESGSEDRPSLWVGAGASFYHVEYGQQNLVGLTALFDADSARRIGIEGEGRWLEFHNFANVHSESYLVGPRYHFDMNRFQPYVKGMVGFGDFNFPYNYASGTYFVVGAGGGVDYRLSYRWSVRVDAEYQNWPQFTFGSMNSVGISSGIRYKIF